MVAITPFRALRYNLERVALSDVICPPYDIISASARDTLCERSPYNFVRLELPRDEGALDRYAVAHRLLESWKQQGILVQETQPAVYITEHRFQWEGQRFSRLGWIALLRFNAAVADQVLGHEATFDAPKVDRTNLLEAVRAQLSPIFCVAPDADHRLHRFLRDVAQASAPTATADVPLPRPVGRGESLGPETIHLWAITEPTAIAALQQSLAGGQALIADGHHRFAVAFANRHLCGGVMTYFACADDPALQVHPIHRVVYLGGIDPGTWQNRLKAVCDYYPVASVEEGMRRMNEQEGPGRFLYYGGQEAAVVRVRDAVLTQDVARRAPLDVTILHQLLLPRLWGAQVPVDAVSYTPSLREAMQMVDEVQPACAWGLRPIPLATIVELASQRIALPQKSTYFYPKAFAGLTIYPF
ncbi:MAG: DUF1015 domain-containing protein [Candidatus Omnitrophica bacterium]|nr:DUF1015 domain-containing protein [Candidatus Omnitrophota bacterium]